MANPLPDLCVRGHVRSVVGIYVNKKTGATGCQGCRKLDAARRKLRAETGEPVPLEPRPDLTLIRFWSKTTQAENGCILWTGPTTRKGYVRFSVKGRDVYAHRWIYQKLVGPVPDDMTIDHLCGVQRCVNPAHMEVVTRAENTRRANAKITHCPQGHEYTPENTRVGKGNKRQCRACARIRDRIRRPRANAA